MITFLRARLAEDACEADVDARDVACERGLVEMYARWLDDPSLPGVWRELAIGQLTKMTASYAGHVDYRSRSWVVPSARGPAGGGCDRVDPWFVAR